MKKLAILFLFSVLSVPSWATWSLVQSAANASCPASSTCSVTVSSTGSGHLIVGIFVNFSGTQRTISSVSGGGTWTLCGANCQGIDTVCGNCSTDAAWTLNSSSGSTSIAFTLSGATTSAVIQVYEFSYSGTASLNSGATPKATRDQTTGATSVAGVTLSLSAVNGLIVQGGAMGATCNAVSGTGWVGTFPGGDCAAYKLNTTDGTAPTWTQNASSRGFLVAVAFEESGAAADVAPMRRPIVY